MTTVKPTRKFRSSSSIRIPSLDQRKRNLANHGIRDSKYKIGFYSEELAELTARVVPEGRDWKSNHRCDLKLCRTMLALHERQLAEHQLTLSSLPPEV
jgi:hypothetical protein